MTPDELTITIVSAIGGACLLSLLVALLVLANVDQLRRLLHIRPLTPPTLPAHYVVPYVEPRPLMEPMGAIHAPAPQRRSTYRATSSDEHLPPRNATPGPSNVPRTPPPAYDPAEAEEYGRFLWTVFCSPTPDLPLITIPNSPEAPVRALLPKPDNETTISPTPVHHQYLLGTLHTRGVRINTPAHLCPLPDSDSDSDSSDYGGNEPGATSGPSSRPLTEPSLALTDLRPGSSAGSTSSLEADSRDQKTESGWGDTSPLPKDPRSPVSGETPPLPRESTTIGFVQSTTPLPATISRTYVQEQPRSSVPSPTYYSPSHWQRETAQISTAPPDFDNFNQDPETFGWAEEEDYKDENPLDYGDYRGYTSAPHFYHQPFPLPDSPTYAGDHQEYPQPHARRIQQYRPPQYGQYQLGGQGPDDLSPEGSGTAIPDPSQPSNQERLDAARRQSETNRREYDVLKAQMEAAQAKMVTYDATWDFNQPPAPSKGKEPDRG
ncbi:uncharacterized protein ARMOST_04302 [Armillaria ostoyae]|uniref:Uncharacterized protein n=1 Tax=Armillaria ostoyae TaxID=47428 RepID=A0A284QWZ5_ARMOS|nr:uncharacterized protein ARMOST_04302 [Armillaria ostoyae]